MAQTLPASNDALGSISPEQQKHYERKRGIGHVKNCSSNIFNASRGA
jgi:hypothetical protein